MAGPLMACQMEQPPERALAFGVVKRCSRSDEELLELVAQQRDEAAFDELYERYARAVYAVVRRLIGDHARSEDVVQEAFTNVWRAASGYHRDRGRATGWLFAIARNAAFDALRVRSAAGQLELPDLADDEPRPDERASAAEEAFRVHAAVDGLSDREREVIELAYFGGFSQTEVAARLGVPLGTVKTRTRRALAHLADRLAVEPLMTS
jgi:RNA polymerase sigma-70 factor, ECF subfamily